MFFHTYPNDPSLDDDYGYFMVIANIYTHDDSIAYSDIEFMDVFHDIDAMYAYINQLDAHENVINVWYEHINHDTFLSYGGVIPAR